MRFGSLPGTLVLGLAAGTFFAGAARGQKVVDPGELGPVLAGPTNGENLGSAVAGIGDLNGDGIHDMAAASFTGKEVVVVFGAFASLPPSFSTANLNGTNGFVVRLGTQYTVHEFGVSIAGIGDLNGDGFDDFAIGTPREHVLPIGSMPVHRGRVHIVFGRNGAFPAVLSTDSLNGVDGFELEGNLFDDQVGGSVAGIGDVDGDGFVDFATASWSKPHVHVIRGAASFPALLGTASFGTGPGAPGSTLQAGPTEDDLEVAGVGDFDADGFTDFVVGSRDAGLFAGGAVYLVRGLPGGPAHGLDLTALNGSAGTVLYAHAPGDELGARVAGAGDFDGDGFADMLLGSPGFDNGADLDVGAATIVRGRPGPLPAALPLAFAAPGDTLTFRGVIPGGRMGTDLAGIDDFNGDGRDDVLLVAPEAGANGFAYVLLGRSSFFQRLSSVGVEISNGGGGFGVSAAAPPAGAPEVHGAAGLGDFDRDGLMDFALGTPFVDSAGGAPNRGAVRIYQGFGGQAYGCGINLPGTLSFTGAPYLGSTLLVTLTNPLGTQVSGFFPFLAVSFLPTPSFPCGVQVPGFGMSAPGAIGELLIDTSPSALATVIAGRPFPVGNSGFLNLTVPAAPSLSGLRIFCQGLLWDAQGPIGPALTEARTLRLGF